jgi:hypothetical protein
MPILYEDYKMSNHNVKRGAYQNWQVPEWAIGLGIVVAATAATYIIAKIIWRK